MRACSGPCEIPTPGKVALATDFSDASLSASLGPTLGATIAVAVDPDFPDANFWLAQVLVWNGAPSDVWSPPASRALASPRGLAPRDGRLAAGLVAMADGRFPEACAAYRQVLRRDTLSFAAWFGLAECNAKDKVVVRDVWLRPRSEVPEPAEEELPEGSLP